MSHFRSQAPPRASSRRRSRVDKDIRVSEDVRADTPLPPPFFFVLTGVVVMERGRREGNDGAVGDECRPACYGCYLLFLFFLLLMMMMMMMIHTCACVWSHFFGGERGAGWGRGGKVVDGGSVEAGVEVEFCGEEG